MRIRATILFLLAIFMVGALVRISGLGAFPPSLNWDEASLGYNAYSLLETGRDEWGSFLPLSFPAFGDYKLPLAVYLSVPVISLFGPTIFAVRLTSAVMGSLSILLGFMLVYRLFKNKYLGLFAAFIVAFQPWTWFFSRIALEANISLTLIMLAGALYLSGKSALSLLFFTLSAWTYNSARGFVPLYLVFLVWHFRDTIGKKIRNFRLPSPVILISLLLLLGVIWQLVSGAGRTRLAFMTLLDSGAIARIEEMRLDSKFPPPLIRLLYNRPSYFIATATTNFFRYLSPDFLFFSGGSHYQFSVQGFGVFSQILLPLFYVGLLTLLIKKDFPRRTLLLSWLVLSLVPGSIVRDAPHPLRAVTFIPIALICIVAGWREISRVFNFSSRMILIPVLLLLPFIAAYVANLPRYTKTYSWAWQYGQPQLVEYVRTNYDHYDRILITKRYGEPHIFFLYFWPWTPGDYRADSHLVRYGRSDWFWVDGFAKFRFVNDWEMDQAVSALNPDENVLIVASPENSVSATRQTTINYPSGDPVFVIYSK